MEKFEVVFEKIINGNLLCEKKFTEKDIPILKKEEKEVKKLLAILVTAEKGLYTAQKDLSFLDRNIKGLPSSKAKYIKPIGSFSDNAVKLYDKVGDYKTKLEDHLNDIQDELINLEYDKSGEPRV